MLAPDALRGRIARYQSAGQLTSAIFLAEILASEGPNSPDDRLQFVRLLMLTGQHRRAIEFIQRRCETPLTSQLLLCSAQSLCACKEWTQCLAVLSSIPASASTETDTITLSSLCVTRAMANEALDNRDQAAHWYTQALRHDPCCSEAFDRLIDHHLLSTTEERDLLNELRLPAGLECIATIYHARAAQHIALRIAWAARHLAQYRFRQCLALTQSVLESDPLHTGCLPLHVAAMVQLNMRQELYRLAHSLFKLLPQHPASWFAVGCYHLLAGNSEAARNHLRSFPHPTPTAPSLALGCHGDEGSGPFRGLRAHSCGLVSLASVWGRSQAIQLDPYFAPAYLALGHAYSAKDADKALLAYRAAARAFPGSAAAPPPISCPGGWWATGLHLPHLCIGTEYLKTEMAWPLAEPFFKQALELCPVDPSVLNELGVLAYRRRQYPDADGPNKDSGLEREALVPVVMNLGHARRKCGQYAEALQAYQEAHDYAPFSSLTLAAVGFAHHLLGHYEEALTWYHRSLGMQADNAFCATVLPFLFQEQALAERTTQAAG
ncbi:putative Cell division cycle protein 16 [Paratrimastix pyriformis]|uniref:Cell division cycle protein 16 n=1 Tax=Paratrimastix pyriformis TaxID=342808 RepID=A0ABQ8UTM8_9EUKA|nr:putative Cell division cycle protein 16 [Paratrimastix pyriformis]